MSYTLSFFYIFAAEQTYFAGGKKFSVQTPFSLECQKVGFFFDNVQAYLCNAGTVV